MRFAFSPTRMFVIFYIQVKIRTHGYWHRMNEYCHWVHAIQGSSVNVNALG